MTKFTWRQLIVLLAVFGLIAGACTKAEDDDVEADGGTTEAPEATDAPATTAAPDDGGEEPAATTTAAPEDVELTATDRGVTADTITVGISMLDFASLKDQGFTDYNWGDQQAVHQAYIDDLNARGGINGRMVEAVYEFYLPIGTVEAEASCLVLTEDTETFAVIGGFVGPAEPANTCITGSGNTVLIGGRVTADRLADAQAPFIQPGMSRAAGSLGLIELGVAEGLLTDKKIALTIEPSVIDDADLVRNAIADNGLELVLDVELTASSGDIAGENAEWEVVAQRILASDADVIIAMGGTTGAVRGWRTNGLADDLELWVTDSPSLASLGTSVTPEDARGVITWDDLSQDESWTQAESEECIEIVAAALPDADLKNPLEVQQGEDRWYASVLPYCAWHRLFEAVATAAGPNLTRESFAEAAAGLGDIALPNGMPISSLSEGKFFSNDTIRLSMWNPDLSAIGTIDPITDPVDLKDIIDMSLVTG